MKISEWLNFLSQFDHDAELVFLCPDGFEENFDNTYEQDDIDDPSTTIIRMLPYTKITEGKKVLMMM